jgi:GT2 family glycosyltransferase
MKKKYPKVSIIIALYVTTDYFYESVKKCLELDYPDFEILIGVDKNINLNFKDKRVRVLKTGELRTGPAEKRDIGIVKAKGDLIAFLDDDSYPDPNWLKKAVEVLNKKKVEAVCGPGLTPPADGFAQKVTGAIIGSKLGSGPYYYRFVKGSPRFVDDFPAYNLIVKRDVLLKIGNFGVKFYGGEDTALCLKLINLGARIFYHPDIVVYHHRREFPGKYVWQVGNVGLHRGYFVKKYPQTSLRPSYFGPSALTLGLPLFLLLSFFSKTFLLITAGGLTIFYLIVFITSIFENSLIVSLFLPFAILVHYFAYGTQFIKGLLAKELER